MNKPIVRCREKSESITVRLPNYHWSVSRDFFLLMVDGLKEKAWNLTGDDDSRGDAEYIEAIADAIREAVKRADEREQDSIRNVFG